MRQNDKQWQVLFLLFVQEQRFNYRIKRVAPDIKRCSSLTSEPYYNNNIITTLIKPGMAANRPVENVSSVLVRKKI